MLRAERFTSAPREWQRTTAQRPVLHGDSVDRFLWFRRTGRPRSAVDRVEKSILCVGESSRCNHLLRIKAAQHPAVLQRRTPDASPSMRCGLLVSALLPVTKRRQPPGQVGPAVQEGNDDHQLRVRDEDDEMLATTGGAQILGEIGSMRRRQSIASAVPAVIRCQVSSLVSRVSAWSFSIFASFISALRDVLTCLWRRLSSFPAGCMTERRGLAVSVWKGKQIWPKTEANKIVPAIPVQGSRPSHPRPTQR